MLARILMASILLGTVAFADDPEPAYTRTENVIYGDKFGVSLTLDVFQPKENANGRGIVLIVSGGWHSDRQQILWLLPREFLRRGYTVFAVVHGRQPKFAIPEILGDLQRAVRFVRFHAADYKVDPDKLGVYGASAGGHLSLMLGTTGAEGDPKATDEVDRVSSRLQCVGCFFPPTDFLNYGKEGVQALGEGVLAGFAGAFDFQELSKETNRFERITDPAKRRVIGAIISPISHVSADDPPTLIVHGDKDVLVPYQQGVIMVEKLKSVGVEAKLITKPNEAHGWKGWEQGEETRAIADWFDGHLK